MFRAQFHIFLLANDCPDITIDTNAPPVGGYIACDRSSIVAGVDEVLLHSIGWTDDYEDLPIMHSFGYVHGYREVTSIAR